MHSGDPNVLQSLEILGDYARNKGHPAVQHHLLLEIGHMLKNPGLMTLYLDEASYQLQDLALGYQRIRSSQINKDPANAHGIHQNLLPRFCRLHSVIHGFAVVMKSAAISPEKEIAGKLRDLQTHSGMILRDFAEHGLTQKTALEILIPHGRELVDPNLKCFSSLPLNTAEGLLLPTSDYTADIPKCFTDQ